MLDVLRDKKEPADPGAILDYYFRVRTDQRPLNEAKLILVGFGAVGKTSLVERLVHGRFDPAEQKTEGIAITDWNLRLHDGEEARLHVWDFGGQEIMHATHQFFLTQRSLYLLVLAGRQGREDADAEYWLSLIGSLAAESPVIVVLNKIVEHPFDLNGAVLRQRFPSIRRVVRTDCAAGVGLNELADIIRYETDMLPNLRDAFPASWFATKERLSSMTDSWLGFEQYRRCCAELGEEDPAAQERLADVLHSLGIALNYRDDPRLRDTHVLNPRWVTEGVYRILNHPRLAEQHGEVSVDDLADILDRQEYPPERHGFLLELMRKFDLCFRFTDQEDRYLVPELLGKEQPELGDELKPELCLSFEYRYPTVVPEGLLPRFIVRSYPLSTGEPRWRTGVVLSFEGSRGLVVADPLARRVRISIAGPVASRRRLLAVIRSDFDRIHASYRSPPEEMVPLPEHPDITVPYAELVAFEAAGVTSFPKAVGGGKVVSLSVQDLLHGVDVAPAITTGRPMEAAPLVFISYSHRDERLKDELDAHLKLFQRLRLLEVWHDRRITPGDEWKGEIDGNVERADLVLLLVSKDFMLSDYCWDAEMARAMERQAEGSAVVIPIIIRECVWHSAPFAKLQALPKDGRAVTTGTTRPARDKAWKQVAEGIERALRELARKPGRRHLA